MRVVVWNCCDAFERKFGHLERLRPDIAIVCEVRPEALATAGLAARSVWVGEPGRKGLAVITYGDWSITGSGPALTERWYVAVEVSNGDERAQVVGVWADSSAERIVPMLGVIDKLEAFIRSAPTVVGGDFNEGVSWDPRRLPGRQFADVLARLQALGFESAWHAATGEAHGAETRATLHWTWHEHKRYHIDFLFFPPDMLAVQKADIGTYQDYVATGISDHLPLVCDMRPVARAESVHDMRFDRAAQSQVEALARRDDLQFLHALSRWGIWADGIAADLGAGTLASDEATRQLNRFAEIQQQAFKRWLEHVDLPRPADTP